MSDPDALISAIEPIAAGAHVVISFLLLFPATAALFGARNPDVVRQSAILFACGSVFFGMAFWTLSLIGPGDTDPLLIHRFGLPLVSVALAAVAVRGVARTRRSARA